MTRLLFLSFLVCFACGDDSGTGRDAAVPRDGGERDSAVTGADSGRSDAAAPLPDSGSSDSGSSDSGSSDSGSSDAGSSDAAIDLAAECATSCAHIVECDARYDREECVRGCTLSAAASDTPECRDRFLSVSMCVLSLECSELPEPMGSEIDLTSTRCGAAITSFVDECVRG
jgi:hypothetical protein